MKITGRNLEFLAGITEWAIEGVHMEIGFYTGSPDHEEYIEACEKELEQVRKFRARVFKALGRSTDPDE